MRGVEKILRGKQNVSETFIENDIDKIKVKKYYISMQERFDHCLTSS